MKKRYGGLTFWEIVLVVVIELAASAIFLYGYCFKH